MKIANVGSNQTKRPHDHRLTLPHRHNHKLDLSLQKYANRISLQSASTILICQNEFIMRSVHDLETDVTNYHNTYIINEYEYYYNITMPSHMQFTSIEFRCTQYQVGNPIVALFYFLFIQY